MLKRFMVLLFLFLSALAPAHAEQTAAPPATPEPIRQYSISEALAKGLTMISRTSPERTDYVLQIGTDENGLRLSLRPAQNDRMEIRAALSGGGESVVLAAQLSQDAIYINLDADTVVIRYADILSAFSSLEPFPYLDEDALQRDADALSVLFEDLLGEFSGVFTASYHHSAVHMSTSLMQLLQAFSRCCDRIAQDEALIDSLLAHFVHPLIPESLIEYKDVLSADTLLQLLDAMQYPLMNEPSDAIFSFSLNESSGDGPARISAAASLQVPLEGGVSCTLTANEDEGGSAYLLSGQAIVYDFSRTLLTLDIQGSVSDESAALRIVPRGNEGYAVTADIAFGRSFSLLLTTPLGMLSIQSPHSFYHDYTVRLTGLGFSLDAETVFSRYSAIPLRFHLGARYPSYDADDKNMRYDYITFKQGDSLQIKLGDSLITAASVPNTSDRGICNVTELTIDQDVARAGDTLCGTLTTSVREVLRSIRVSQTLTEQNKTLVLWSLEASPCVQPADAILDAQVLDADFLLALPDRIIRYYVQENAASQSGGDTSISVQ